MTEAVGRVLLLEVLLEVLLVVLLVPPRGEQDLQEPPQGCVSPSSIPLPGNPHPALPGPPHPA